MKHVAPRATTARRQRGAVLVVTLFLVLLITMLLIGVGTSSTSHQKRAYVDKDWAAAMDVAEAGLNYEMRKISQNTANADQSPGATYSVGNGSYKVWCANTDGTTPWVPPNDLHIRSTGTVNGVARTVQITAHRAEAKSDYAVYAVQQGEVSDLVGTPTIDGDMGTNGGLTVKGNPNINGGIDINGPGSSISETPAGKWPYTSHSTAIPWLTVDQTANAMFPGGLAFLAGTNDNGMASPPIVNKAVSIAGGGTLTLIGKLGGANYYLNSLSLKGNSTIVFNNAAGPINVWFGPSGSAGTVDLAGCTSTVKMDQDPQKACRIYSALSGDVNMQGTSEMDVGVYTYNGPTGGRVVLGGTPQINGSIVSTNFKFNGSPTLNYKNGYFQAISCDYVFDGSWFELTAR